MSFEQNFTPIEVMQENLAVSNADESNVVASNGPNVEINSTPNEIESPISCEVDTEGLKRKLTSEVWNHFKRQKIDGKLETICNYCGAKLLGVSKQGTSHLKSHIKSCPR
ncbi:unnamed protein product [Lathyrus sativus]|nr:unnamed protein product [Lathyrus sativus]